MIRGFRGSGAELGLQQCCHAHSARQHAGLALSLGCEGGLLFTVAHELLHSTRPLDKTLSNVLLCSVGYMHWTCSHHAHHKNVGPHNLLPLRVSF